MPSKVGLIFHLTCLVYVPYVGVKGQGHNVCASLQAKRNIAAAAAYVSCAGFSLL